jgi:nucleotidyltransferase/DNA polymerase involved in DNA repair
LGCGGLFDSFDLIFYGPGIGFSIGHRLRRTLVLFSKWQQTEGLTMYAIIDCNSFYCSCERLFLPHLKDKPVVVLSNNDGCIISRSDEAKNLGVEMAGPYFKAVPLIRKYGVATFSSNYHLYGDLSWRVMETLRSLVPEGHVEVYSVDEAFVDLSHIAQKDIAGFSMHLRETVEMWTGIKVSVGVAPTKVLSKVANRLSKKYKEETNCVLVLDTPRKIEKALQKTPIGDVWGIGYQYAEKLRRMNIETAFDLSAKDIAWANKYLGGVTGSRLVRELKGIESIHMMDELLSEQKNDRHHAHVRFACYRSERHQRSRGHLYFPRGGKIKEATQRGNYNRCICCSERRTCCYAFPPRTQHQQLCDIAACYFINQ